MLSVVAEPVYLSRPLSLAEMTDDQLQRAADQLREFALSELAFIEHQLTEVAPLRADAFGDWERKQAKLAEIQAEKWQWLGLSLGLVEAVLVAWPWGYLEAYAVAVDAIRVPCAYAINQRASSDDDDWIRCENWPEISNQIAEQRVDELKKKGIELPGVNGLAQFVEGELSERRLLTKHGTKIKWTYIKTKFPRQITGRLRNGQTML